MFTDAHCYEFYIAFAYFAIVSFYKQNAIRYFEFENFDLEFAFNDPKNPCVQIL